MSLFTRLILGILALTHSLMLTANTAEMQVRFERIESRGGFHLGQVDAIFQDSLGFIWMGGEDGLIRFDGYEFKVFRSDPSDPSSLSNNTVWAIDEDTNGDLWVATEGGVNRFIRRDERFERFQQQGHEQNGLNNESVRSLLVSKTGLVYAGTFGGGLSVINPKTKNVAMLDLVGDQGRPKYGDKIWALMESEDGALWIGTEGSGATRYHPSSGRITHYGTLEQSPHNIAHDTVRALFEDSNNEIWLGTDQGVHRLNSYGMVVDHWQHQPEDPRSLGSNIIWDILQDSRGSFWIATDGGGLNIFKPSQNRFQRLTHDAFDPLSISSDVVRRVIEDQAGDIWTANFPTGANVFHRSSEHVTFYRYRPNAQNSLSHPSVLSFYEDDQERLWIGTDGGGLNRFDARTGFFEHYKKDPASNSISANAVLSIEPAEQGALWIGTWGGGLNWFDPKTGVFRHYAADPKSKSALANANVWAMQRDAHGILWLGSEGGGLQRFDPKTEVFTRYPYESSPSEYALLGSIVWCIIAQGPDLLWVGTDLGLNLFNKRTGIFEHFTYDASDPNSLSSSTVLSAFIDRDGRLWVGTRAGLNLLKEDGTFKRIGVEQGLASDVVTAITQDMSGSLWLGTTNGLARYNPENGKVRNYNQSSWAQGKFNFNSVLNLKNGTLLFGGVNGFVSFDPNNLNENHYIPPVVITDFQLFNQSQKIAAPGSPLEKSLWATDVIALDHKQSVFSFEFAALNYIDSQNNSYAFKLAGFDQDWSFVGSQRRATYTNLSPGNYIFQVKAANNDGLWNEGVTEIRVSIAPAPWQTWWAYSIYVLLIFAALWVYLKVQKNKIENERQINEKLRNLDRLKDNFLANTSHELRTPLNGIIGLAESLADGTAGEVNSHMAYNLRMIASSGKRLANLVNDILDFAKLKKQDLSIKLTPQNLRLVVEDVLVISRTLVGNKDLDVTNAVDSDLPAVLADENRLQQILHNLIGNAIKFTDRGSVMISADVQEDRIWVRVKDTGIGIAENNLNKIFDSFQQLEDHGDRHYGGTGLGLSITKHLVEMHEGELLVSSSVGVGSTFSFSLPYSDDIVPSGDLRELSVSKVMDISRPASLALMPFNTENRKPFSANHTFNSANNHRFKILLVDDEPVNRQVLLNQLSMYDYQLVEAANGQDALDCINEQSFDLVLLDVMMPGISGYEVCAEIRQKHSINELPIIFLTAKNLIADLVDGFEVGANDFLTKPIAKGELVSRVRTHLQLLDVNKNLEQKIKERTEEVERTNKILETLDGIVATINQEVILERLVDVLLREAARLFPVVQRCIYWSYNERTETYVPNAHSGYSSASLQNVSMSKALMEQRYKESGEKLCDNIYLLKPTGDTPGADQFYGLTQAHSILALAISFDDCVVGYLNLINVESQEAFAECDLQTIQRFYAHAKSALLKARLMQRLKLQNQELEDSNLTDSLTGLRNRRYLLKYLDSDVALTLRSHRGREKGAPIPPNSDLLFYMVDIDHFKSVNDQHGQAAGDKILVQVKQILEKVFRESDFMVRWGGEEFLVVARFSNRKAAALIADRLKQAVGDHVFDLGDGETTRITCSIGFSFFPYLTSDPIAFSWSQVLDIADMCLYAAKKSGRNCWVALEAHADWEDQLDFQSIAARPEQMINRNYLLLHTSLPPSMPIYW